MRPLDTHWPASFHLLSCLPVDLKQLEATNEPTALRKVANVLILIISTSNVQILQKSKIPRKTFTTEFQEANLQIEWHCSARQINHIVIYYQKIIILLEI